ncbi:uncharacterized protein LOC131284982 [Anopheles ziemanni]|uniref:uncharacterized protein LOC131284982 n=1 Tax=Anopheles ziemanni TaxID=345580 RepID=UPI00265F87B3|nr:uncharacterized protein LOC131284982 [Anopheles ziemanni]
MIIARLALVWLCISSFSTAHPGIYRRAYSRRKGSFIGAPVKYKRQTEATYHPYVGIDRSRFEEELYPDESSDESMVHLRQKASVAEVFRNRLMACGLITTKSPERWRDRLVAELDDIITDIEHRCAVCKSLYDEPCRYELLRSLINPCPACCRQNAKKRLLLTLQKVLEKSFDNENMPEDGESTDERISGENGTKSSLNWQVTDVPKTRKTRSTTELPIEITTNASGTRAPHTMTQKHKFGHDWWPQQTERSTGSTTVRYNATKFGSNLNFSSAADADLSSMHVINGQTVNNVHDFLQQYMNLVYGGQPGNEQRRQFFLDQLCRNATNGRIVLQCKDITGHRKVRSPAETVPTWNAGQNSYTASDVQRSLLFATTPMNGNLTSKSHGKST